MDYAEEAAGLYSSGKYPNIAEAFLGDFEYWEDRHFKVLPNPTLTSIRDALIAGCVSVEKRVGLKIYKALADYKDKYRKDGVGDAIVEPEKLKIVFGLFVLFER